MNLFNRTPYKVAVVSRILNPEEPFLTIVIKGTFQLIENGPCVALPTEKQAEIGLAIEFEDKVGNSRKSDGDTVAFKPRADCLFVGSAFSPRGEPVKTLEVAFGLGNMNKTLWVYGDRRWVRGADGSASMEGPATFTEMPIRAELAHGGPTSAYNRHGIGFGPLDAMPGASIPVANIQERGASALRFDVDNSIPSGFGTLSPHTKPRIDLAGTHDDKWFYRRKPLPPEDFNPDMMCSAPRDQQIEGYLNGDEYMTFKNLHPEKPDLRSYLPGTRVRAFVNHGPNDRKKELAEVKTVLDTCLVDMPAGTVTLIWRGTVATAPGHEYDQIEDLLVAEEGSHEHKPLVEYRKMMTEQRNILFPPPEPPGPTPEEEEIQNKKDREALDQAADTLVERGGDPALAEKVRKSDNLQDALNLLTREADKIREKAEAFKQVLDAKQ